MSEFGFDDGSLASGVGGDVPGAQIGKVLVVAAAVGSCVLSLYLLQQIKSQRGSLYAWFCPLPSEYEPVRHGRPGQEELCLPRLFSVEVEVVGEDASLQKRWVHAAAGDDEEPMVVIQLGNCRRGRPLVPDVESQHGWRPQTDEEAGAFTLKGYFERLVLPDGLSTSIGGRELNSRYQVAVHADHWYAVWTALAKPWATQRSLYRHLLGGKNAPDLLFGVEPRWMEGTESTDTPPARPASHDSPRASSAAEQSTAASTVSNQGLVIGWSSGWEEQDLPVRSTFIHFAQHLGARSGAQTRSSSAGP